MQIANPQHKGQVIFWGETGPQGPQGPQGDIGAAALRFYTVIVDGSAFSGFDNEIVASCEAGDLALEGNFVCTSPSFECDTVVYPASGLAGDRRSFSVTARQNDSTFLSSGVRVTTGCFGITVPTPLTLSTVAKGRVREDGNIGGGGVENHFAGVSAGFLHRSFFVFELSGLDPASTQVTSAKLTVFNPAYDSPDAGETLAIRLLSESSVAELVSGADPISISVFQDAGQGVVVGERAVSAGDDNNFVEIELGQEALQALNDGTESLFGLSGRITTLSGQTAATEGVFSGAGPSALVELVLTTTQSSP